ncbi:MAG: polysaccharide deacetylase family protein [Acidobacteria bacterium]|nr:polysaccharide deacetylase family protein [Acidobacteriota bacterium]
MIAVLAMLTGLGVVVWYLVAAPGSQLLGPTIVRGPHAIPAVALTFDDGPGEDTAAILDTLKSTGARATFFLCGRNVERYPELARRIAQDGHEIGNHTYAHPRLMGRSPGKLFLEIDRAQKVIEHHTGRAPELFRPPYGLRWFGLFPILRQLKMQAVMWSVNGRDWNTGPEEITQRILRQAHPGAIILLHDGLPPQDHGDRRATVQALPAIIRILGGRYRFVTVSEMQSRS